MGEPVKRCPHGYLARETYCNKCLKAELDRFRAEYDEMGVLLAYKHNVISALRAELAAMKRADWKAAHIKDLEAQLTERRDRVDDLDKEIEALRKRVGELEADKVRFQQQLEDFRTDTRDERTRAEQAEAQLAEAKARIAELEAKVKEAEYWWNQIKVESADRLARAERAEALAGIAIKDVVKWIALRGDERVRAERAEASHEQQVIVAANYAERVERAEAELAEAKEQAHYANGVADLAMKHRNSAEAQRDAMRCALAPFAHYADAMLPDRLPPVLQALIGEMMERLPYPEHLEAINLFCKACQEARAALAPSPAGEAR